MRTETSLDNLMDWIGDGSQIVMSAGESWAPMAVLREIVRRGVKDLRLVGVVGGGINMDFPIGAGAVASLDTCSVSMRPFSPNGPNHNRHVVQGRIKMLDNT